MAVLVVGLCERGGGRCGHRLQEAGGAQAHGVQEVRQTRQESTSYSSPRISIPDPDSPLFFTPNYEISFENVSKSEQIHQSAMHEKFKKREISTLLCLHLNQY